MTTLPVKDANGTTVNVPLPVAGQATMANSTAVAIASDQSAVPVSGTFWPTTQPVSLAALPALPAGTSAIGTVTTPETTFFNDTTTALTGAATFTGTARDVGVAAGTATPTTYFNAFGFADQAGTLSIECSNDNTTWRTAASVALTASAPQILTVPVMTRYHRVKLVNGATAQGSVMVNSSYTGA